MVPNSYSKNQQDFSKKQLFLEENYKIKPWNSIQNVIYIANSDFNKNLKS